MQYFLDIAHRQLSIQFFASFLQYRQLSIGILLRLKVKIEVLERFASLSFINPLMFTWVSFQFNVKSDNLYGRSDKKFCRQSCSLQFVLQKLKFRRHFQGAEDGHCRRNYCSLAYCNCLYSPCSTAYGLSRSNSSSFPGRLTFPFPR